MRKVEDVVAASGRDAGKTFRITEWPAIRGEKWALRMFIALKGTGGYVPTDIEESIARLGMVGVAIRGLNAFLGAPVRFEDVEPLWDEMLTCIEVVRDPRHPEVASALNVEQDVEDVHTLGWLRSEVLRVHTGFSLAEVWSRLTSAMTSAASSSTSTSPPTSGSHSPPTSP